MITPITLDDARAIRDALERYLRNSDVLGVPGDMAAMLRSSVVGEPFEGSGGIQIPPWRLDASTATAVELTWTIDLGHDSGTRRWFVAHVERVATGWRVRDVSVAHARRARP